LETDDNHSSAKSGDENMMGDAKYIFLNLKKHLSRFLTDDELEYAMEEWLKGQSKLFVLLALKTDCYQMCIDRNNVCSFVYLLCNRLGSTLFE